LALYPYAFFITLPLYRRVDGYSADEYLERRFHQMVRTLASCIFILWRLGWMATALYVPALAITTATGRKDLLPYVIMLMGLVSTIYTMMGGIKAVIWTEVIQFVVMFGGLALTLLVVMLKVDVDFGQIWATFMSQGAESEFVPKAELLAGSATLAAIFTSPVTWYGLLIASIAGRATGYTGDQVMIQRFQTAKSIRDTRQGFLITAISDVVWMTVLTLVGVVLVIYFQRNTEPLPSWLYETNPTTGESKLAFDMYFPYFMSKVFPPGLTGPVIAAIVAASLSAIASAINSQSTVVVVDFYNRIIKRRVRPVDDLPAAEQRFQVLLGRIASVVVGVVATVIAMNLGKLGIIMEISNKVVQSFTGPLLGIFWLGMFTRKANSFGAFLGGLMGTIVAVFVAFDKELFLPIFGFEHHISFYWPTVFGLVSALVIGYIASLPFPISESARKWNWFTVTSQPLVE
jgi:SSS family transporter